MIYELQIIFYNNHIFSNPADPEEVTLVREEYIGLIKQWIAEAPTIEIEENDTL